MSTAPNPAPPANNKSMFALAGLIGGVVVLCSGLMVMALVSGFALDRGHAYGTNRPTGGPTTKETGTNMPSDREPTGDGAHDVARRFLTALRTGRYDDAYNLTSSELQSDETQDAFRARMEKMTAIRNYKESSLERPTGRNPRGNVTFSGYVSGPNGMARFTIDVVQEENGNWRVNRFENS